MTQPLASILDEGLAALELALDAEDRRRLLDYIALLEKWNRSYNLTAVRKPAQMVTRHLLDSLAVAPYLHGVRVLDVGTGAGLPGIPLAVACPERRFVLLDSNGKKARFVTQAVAELGLENVDVVQSRVDEYQSPQGFDTIISRAYTTIAELTTQSRHLLAEGGIFLIMKGVYPKTEVEELPKDLVVERIHELTVPGLDAERHVLIVKPVSTHGPNAPS